MRRYFIAVLCCYAVAVSSRAQSGFTKVTAVVIDPNGNPYAGCRGNSAFVPSPSATTIPTIGGSTFQTDVPISGCDSFGAFTTTLADNNIVQDGHTSLPASQWRFNITSQDGKTSFFCILTVTGLTQNISTQIQACAPPLSGGGGGGGSKGSMYRFNIAGSTPLVAGDFSFNGWGTGATISSIVGTDTAFSFTMTAGTTPTINPTVTLTFHDGPWTNIYSVNAQTDNGSGNQTYIQEDHTLSSVTLTYLNLPQATKTYKITATVVGTTNIGNIASPLNAVVMNPNGDQTIQGPHSLILQGPVFEKNAFGTMMYVDCANSQQWAGNDYGAWIMSAIAALPTVAGFKSGTVMLPACATTVTQLSPVSVVSPYVSIVGAGSSALQISCQVNGDCFNIRTSPFSIILAGTFGGFTLIGQGSSLANAVGIHTGDMSGSGFNDIQIDNFLGANSSCFWMDNKLGWFERNYLSRIELGIHNGLQNGCTKDLRATVNGGTNSFARTRFVGSNISVAAGKTGISLEDGIFWYEGTLEFGGNMVGNGGTVMAMSGSANLFNDRIDIGVECTNTCSSATMLSATGTSTMSWINGRFTGGAGFTNSITTSKPIHFNYGSYDQSNQDRVNTPNIGFFNNEGSNFGTWILSPLGSPAFLGGITDNLGYDGTNFVTATDLTNNGAEMFVGGHNGQISLITIPTSSPATGQTIAQGSITGSTRMNISDTSVAITPPVDLIEQTNSTCVAAKDRIWGDTTSHEIDTCTNGGNIHKMFQGDKGKCSMSSSTTCTFSIGAAFNSTPLTFASIDAASTVPATANVAKCSISGTTVTITAGISNSLTWDCLLVGNPN